MTALVERLLRLVRIDLATRHGQPRPGRLALATIVAVFGSLGVDAVLVALGKAAFPSTRDYGHFQFHDYARLTIVGVLIACVAWPIVARIAWAPRWLFVRLAVLVTLVLWLPDLYLLHQGQSVHAVLVLMVMHVAIAVVTYESLVRLAPPIALPVAVRAPLRQSRGSGGR